MIGLFDCLTRDLGQDGQASTLRQTPSTKLVTISRGDDPRSPEQLSQLRSPVDHMLIYMAQQNGRVTFPGVFQAIPKPFKVDIMPGWIALF